MHQIGIDREVKINNYQYGAYCTYIINLCNERYRAWGAVPLAICAQGHKLHYLMAKAYVFVLHDLRHDCYGDNYEV